MSLKSRAAILLFIIVGIYFSAGVFKYLPLLGQTLPKNEKKVFSGVLRLWIFEKNHVGSKKLSSWLSSESTKFEKKNNGIYIQITPVSEETVRNFACKAEYPPDMIVVPPGILENEDALLSIKNIPGFDDQSCLPSSRLIPIAAGSHIWCVKRQADSDFSLSGKSLIISGGVSSLSAIAALCGEEISPPAPSEKFGLDLSLPESQRKMSSASQTRFREIIPGKGSRRSDHPVPDFKKGACDAVLLNMNELVSLLNASDAPDFEIVSTGERFLSETAFFAVTDTDKTCDREKQALCEKFLFHLLSDEAQSRLSSVHAFSVTGSKSIYGGKRGLSEAEAFLFSGSILFPDPTAPADSAAHEAALESFLSGKGGAREYFSKHISK